MQLQQLYPSRSDEDIETQLGQLPKDLDESYAEIYKNNTKLLGKKDKAHVDRAFMWVMCAAHPMPKQWLLDAVRLTTTEIEDTKVLEKALLHLCQHLLVFDSRGYWGFWRFPHASVAEYFEKNHWTLVEANTFVASVCLSQLIKLYSSFDPASLPVLSKSKRTAAQRPFLPVMDYVRSCWPIHIQALEHEAPESLDQDMVLLLKRFLGRPMESSRYYQRWILHMNRDDWIDMAGAFRIDAYLLVPWLEPAKFALFAMVHLSLTTPLLDWWEKEDMDVSIKNTSHSTLLILSQSVRVSELLLARGADIDHVDEYRHSAIYHAVDIGDMDMLKFLVKKGAKVNEEYITYTTASGKTGTNVLDRAISRRHLETVKFLVEEAGADVNMKLTGDSLLASAAGRGLLDILKYLIKKGANVHETLNGVSGSTLAAASFYGNLDTVRFLVEEMGVDPNTPLESGNYGSVLAIASSIPVIEYLAKSAGANVNAQLQQGYYGSALAAHAAQGNINNVKFLVEKGGADVNMPLTFGKHRSALEAAKASGSLSLDVVLYLEGGSGKSPFSAMEHNFGMLKHRGTF